MRVAGALHGIVPAKLFDAAKRILGERRLSNHELLARLGKLWKRKGRLSGRLIDSARRIPTANVYRSRFGSLRRAYELIGYETERDFAYADVAKRTRILVQNLIDEAATHVRHAGGVARADRQRSLLIIDGKTTLLFAVARYTHYWGHTWCWRAPASRHSS